MTKAAHTCEALRLSGLEVWQELREEFIEILAALNAGCDCFVLEEQTFPQYKLRVLEKYPYKWRQRTEFLGEIVFEPNEPGIVVDIPSRCDRIIIPFEVRNGNAAFPGSVRDGSRDVIRRIAGPALVDEKLSSSTSTGCGRAPSPQFRPQF